MDHTGLFCATATQSWNGPKGSTFSPDWKDSLTFLTPDVIKPPLPANQPIMAGLHHPHGVFVSASGPRVGPMDQNQVAALMIEQSYATVQKDRRGRPLSAIDPHRRSQSLCAAAAAVAAPDTDLVTLRRRCESYAMAYPSSSSDDSGSDSASTRKGELLLPDAVPRPRARSIILRKPKQRPPPPTRTVSLGKTGERRCQSLYIPRDLHSTLLPDLIPIGSKLEDGEQSPLPVDSSVVAAAKLKTSASVPASSTHSRPLNELRSSEPCKSQPGSVPPPPPPGVAVSETAKTPSSSDSLTSPTSSSRSSPSQPPATSPSKPTGSTSPSSGYSSQCETPTSSVRTAAIFGPSPMGCRMRPKPAGQKSRASRVRLSLQLPETTAPPAPDESADPVKPGRRYSDSSATVKTKQRCLSMLLPVVTQEDLMNVRLRSVSSSDNEGGRYEGFAEAIAEEAERDTPTPSIESPKNKPPVAPKPAASAWQPVVTAQKDQPETREPQQHNGPERRRAPIPKPKRSSLSLAGSGGGEHPHPPNLGRSLSSSVSETQLPSNAFLRQNTDYSYDPNDKRRMGPPQVAKKPEVLILPNGHGVCNKDGMTGHIPAHATHDQRLVNGNIAMQHYMSAGHMHGKYNTMGRNPSSERYQHGVPDPRMMQGFEEGQDEVFASKTSSRTTEDLFTIIHRSKRKLLGRKDSFEGRPSDMGMLTLGGNPRASSQNDSFMALLRRTRSAKSAPAGRISATELLKSSKPTTAGGQPYDATRP